MMKSWKSAQSKHLLEHDIMPADSCMMHAIYCISWWWQYASRRPFYSDHKPVSQCHGASIKQRPYTWSAVNIVLQAELACHIESDTSRAGSHTDMTTLYGTYVDCASMKILVQDFTSMHVDLVWQYLCLALLTENCFVILILEQCILYSS